MLLTLDFETHKIVSGSALPPKPVGLAIKENDGPGKYYAWGQKKLLISLILKTLTGFFTTQSLI